MASKKAADTSSTGGKSMTPIAKWNGHTFQVTANIIYSFEKFTLKGYSETEDKTSKSQKYVNRKNSKPYEVSLTIPLNRYAGVKDVKSEAIAWVDEARQGKSDYLYLNGDKLMKCKYMLTEADVSECEILPTGEWISCNVKCTFKQSSVIDGTTETKTSSSHHHRKSNGNSDKDTWVDTYSGSSSNPSGWKPKKTNPSNPSSVSSEAKKRSTNTKLFLKKQD